MLINVLKFFKNINKKTNFLVLSNLNFNLKKIRNYCFTFENIDIIDLNKC